MIYYQLLFICLLYLLISNQAFYLSHKNSKIIPFPRLNSIQRNDNKVESLPNKSDIISSMMKSSKLSIILFSTIFMMQSDVIADQKSILPLETAVRNLESSTDRATVVQSLADLYESSGEKTLLARSSKYKYVYAF